MPLIRLESVSFAYENSALPALDAITLDIDAGEYVAVVGANGSGKSTLLRLLNGLRQATSGKVFVAGMDASMSANVARDTLDGIPGFPVAARSDSRDRRRGGRGLRTGEPGPRPRRDRGARHRGARRGGTDGRAQEAAPLSLGRASSSGWRSPAPWPCMAAASPSTRPPPCSILPRGKPSPPDGRARRTGYRGRPCHARYVRSRPREASRSPGLGQARLRRRARGLFRLALRGRARRSFLHRGTPCPASGPSPRHRRLGPRKRRRHGCPPGGGMPEGERGGGRDGRRDDPIA